MRVLVLICALILPSALAAADGLPVRLHAPQALVETGLFRYLLPRFTLKTRVRVEMVGAPDGAQVVLGAEGRPIFAGGGAVWHVAAPGAGRPETDRFVDWLTGDVGRRTVLAYAPEGAALFAPVPKTARAVAAVEPAGDARLGGEVSRTKCSRCHVVSSAMHMAGIESTPSFALLRSLPDWTDRFAAFYARNPHPAFTIVADVTPPFPDNRPSPIAPLEMTLDEVEAVLAYVAAMDAADLGAPLAHQ